MQTTYIRFGRKLAIPSTVQIKDEIRRIVLPVRPAAISTKSP